MLNIRVFAVLSLLTLTPTHGALPSLNEGCQINPEMELTAEQLAVAGNVGNADNIFMPPGCTCKEANVVASACTKFDCGW